MARMTSTQVEEGIRAGLIQVEIVPGALRTFEVVITNGSGVKRARVNATAAYRARNWGQRWAVDTVSKETGECWRLMDCDVVAE